MPTPPADTLPNAAVVDDPSTTSDKRLDWPSIFLIEGGEPVQITFRNNFNLQDGFDGGVLELSPDGGIRDRRVELSITFGHELFRSLRQSAAQFSVDAGYCYIWLAGGYATDGVAPLLDGNLLLSPPVPTGRQLRLSSKSDADTSVCFVYFTGPIVAA